MAKKINYWSDNKVTMFDGWQSLFSALTTGKGNKANLKYKFDRLGYFTDELLDDMYMHDGYTHRVIDCITEDMVNKGFTIPGDISSLLMNEADRLNITGVLFEAISQARLHGGSAILFGIDDGQTLDKPLSVNSIKKINFIRTIPKTNIVPSSEMNKDPMSADYGKPLYFQITDSISEYPIVVDPSRLYLFSWLEFSPIKARTKYYGSEYGRLWGTSAIESIYKQLGNLSILGDGISHLAQEAVIGKYKLSGLREMLANKETESKVLGRLDIINQSKDLINGVVIDADHNEDYTRDSLQFSGMNGVADSMMIFLSGVCGIPVTRLFGRSPSGLDASGESDLKIYYDQVSALQKIMLTPFLKRFIFYVDKYMKVLMQEDTQSMLQTARNGVNKNKAKPKLTRPLTESDVSIRWNPLYQMTEEERAKAYFTNAEADTIYAQAGILSKEEIRRARFLGGYNDMVSVETADIPQTEDEPEEEDEETITGVTKTRKTTVRVR